MELVNRQQAKALGLKTYFTGKSCSRGHISERYTQDCSCIACSKEYTKSNKDKRKEYIKVYNSLPENKLKNKVRMEKFLDKYSSEYTSNKNKLYNSDYASFDTYFNKLTAEEQPRNNNGILEVKCTYCGNYFKPKQMHVNKRVQCLKGNYPGESRLYCSENCKEACPIYGQQLYIKGSKPYENTRPLQSEWKKLAIDFKRANSIDDKIYCEKCGASEDVGLTAHHIDPVVNNPIESADIDNCILLCYTCDRLVHKIPGCTIGELKCS